ncbi:MAG: tRNA lysidine(34) synthetase TilS [Verrucomicrobiota bacterium]
MKSLLESVGASIGARKLFRAGERILVAVSGGVDSMVLLAVLRELAGAQGWRLFVAHFNHQLRGRVSAGDERFVQQTAERLGLPFQSGRGAVKVVAKAQGISIEMAARQLRHEFLAQTARRWSCSVVALAHHADDQVELFFLRLLRGSGGEGAAGMKWSSLSPVNKSVRLVRPLLEMNKSELMAFACANKIRFREDATNASGDILRNRVRHELLPLVRQEFQPAINRTVLRLMELVGAEAEVVETLAHAWLAKFPRCGGWNKLAVGVQRRVIQLQLQRHKFPADFELVERLRLQPAKLVSVAEDQFMVREPSGRVKRVVAENRAFDRAERRLNLKASGQVIFGGLQVSWDFALKEGARRPKSVPQCEFFDADQVGATVVLRYWRPGDRFQPIGMKAAVKLQDWFTNQKIPATRRRELLLATTVAGEIFWVEGLRIGEGVKLTKATRKVLVWRWCVR